MSTDDDEGQGHPDPVESIFLAVRQHVLRNLATLPPGADGMVEFTPQQLAVTMLAATLQLCVEMKVEPAAVGRVIFEVVDTKDMPQVLAELTKPKLVLC